MSVLLALLPILLFAALLVLARWSAAAAGLAGATTALVVAMLAFGLGQEPSGLTLALLGPLAEAAFSSATILLIVFGALCIHEFQSRSGAVTVFGQWLGSFGSDRRVTALFVAWFFALLLEGAAGFGTPIAMAAPLLIGLGFTPVGALTLVLIGHAVGVSFGAVGTPIVPLLTASEQEPHQLSIAIALLHSALAGGLVVWLWQRAGQDSSTAGQERRGRSWVLAAAALFLVPFVALAWFVGPELPTLGGALLGVVAFAGFARWRQRGSNQAPVTRPGARALLSATLPYLVVIALILLTRLVTPLRDVLREATLDWTLQGGYSGSVALLYHPGSLLLLGLVIAGLLLRTGRAQLLPAAGRAAARLPMVALALLSVLLLARLMVHSGMISLLASTAATTLGTGWLLAAPAVGALGSFITGSATTSNILFGDFQHAAAQAVGLPPLLAATGQGFGAAMGNAIAPHNIVVGAAAVGLIGSEGQVLQRTLPVCLAYVAAGGLLLFGVSLVL